MNYRLLKKSRNKGFRQWWLVLLIPLLSMVWRRILARQPKPFQYDQRQQTQPERAKFAVWKEEKPVSQPAQRVKDESQKIGVDETRERETKRASTPQDDLKVIEGIGPKISEILNNAGITTYRQLAETSVDRLNEILLENGLRINPPDTWPEQAGLAADGKWDALKDLKGQLHAGRADKNK